MEIQYFMARDFSLDPKLYKACAADAQDICQADIHWYTNTQHHPLVFACLTRNLYSEDDLEEDLTHLSDDCADEVERVLEERAISVKLHPEIDDSCRSELSSFCIGATGVGEEFQCLQENFDHLGEECLNAIKSYTEMEAKNVILNPVIAAACHQYIDKFCAEEVSRRDEGLVIQCLIKLRDDRDEFAMADKCSSAVEHWQILSLKDWRFSYQFKEACKNDIKSHCAPRMPSSKADIIQCLSEIARNDVIQEKTPRTLAEACSSQLKFQLLQKHTSINLNPKVAANCKKAIKLNCPIGRGNVLECLKGLDLKKMSALCRQAVFQEEQEEVLIQGVDHQLLIGCKHEIKSHCPQQNEVNGLLNCLKEAKKDANFDRGCKMIVNKRIIQHTRDYRLRPRLQRACEHDLVKFCSQVMLEQDQGKDLSKDYLEGHVVQCLQHKFVEDADLLTPQCRHELEVTVRDEAMDYRANPIILAECPLTIRACQHKIAKESIDNSTSFYGSKVEECLRSVFKDGDVPDGMACSRAIADLIEATNIDIKADPLLHKACAVDISKFCRDVPHGSGQQLKCLSNVIRDAKLGLEPKCDAMLRARLEMFDRALKVVPINGIQDLWIHVRIFLASLKQTNFLKKLLLSFCRCQILPTKITLFYSFSPSSP